ncbi:hypothetical protein GDO81_008486 [Engystomops pustulosus]|uniref:Helix-turn-helix domain-containing protein n=1 Tax=Engystomops pustulosus TaxID=76066 RepID=A0AAV7CEY2_ENGPU|nr:hypothetical protein GDO81_008486 [Engystomops pustulosus]
MYQKPTSTNSYLCFLSYHPSYVKRAIPYGQYIRLRRINNRDDLFITQAKDITERLRKRSYPQHLLKQAMERALKMIPEQLLCKPCKKRKN